ncbi:MAG TPA: hypothetical protein PLV65_06835 [Tenuifilaceae bacterium]|nr:hypothetical protein [Tenuifilaceae bacterium]
MQKIATGFGIIGVIIFSIVLIFGSGENSSLTDFARGFLTGISIVFIVAFLVFLISRLFTKRK